MARVLGDLPPLIDDLVPTALVSGSTRALEAIPQRAVARWEKQRRDAVWSFFSASTICWVIWLVIGLANQDMMFAWPVFVMLGTGIHAARVQFNRTDIIADETRRLEKKERTSVAFDDLQRRFLGPGQPYWHQRDPHRRRRDGHG